MYIRQLFNQFVYDDIFGLLGLVYLKNLVQEVNRWVGSSTIFRPVAKSSLFRYGAKMWRPLDVGAVGRKTRAFCCHTRLRNGLSEKYRFSLKVDCKKPYF